MNQPCATIQCGTPSSSVAMSSGANQRHDPHRHHRCRLNRHLLDAARGRVSVARAALSTSKRPSSTPASPPFALSPTLARPRREAVIRIILDA
jgi:hypothetical protein